MPQPIISETTIAGNVATDGYGGGLFVGPYPSSVLVPTPTITSSNISQNYAGVAGGGAYLANTEPTISNSCAQLFHCSTDQLGLPDIYSSVV